MANTWHILFCRLDHIYLGNWSYSNRMLLFTNLFFKLKKIVQLAFIFYTCFKHSEDNFNCMYRPEDLS